MRKFSFLPRTISRLKTGVVCSGQIRQEKSRPAVGATAGHEFRPANPVMDLFDFGVGVQQLGLQHRSVTFPREGIAVRPKSTLVAISLLLLLRPDAWAKGPKDTADVDRPEALQAALEAARWIRSTAVQTAKGTAWPTIPGDPGTVRADLYGGACGPVLFFLEAYRSTKDRSYLKDARAGADFLLRSLEGEKQTGLYVGLAGIGFTLQETFKATGSARYRNGARRCVETIRRRARRAGKGVEWDGGTDVISGAAGTGLFLLYAARELHDDSARDLAGAAGSRLIELARPAAGGLKWAMSPRFKWLMPNFSHGTAGVAYFLASLARESKQKEFLKAALAGARYLQAVARTEGDACLVFHHEPGGEDLFYLGWCHGPAGTARLFYRLYQATNDRQWLEWTRRAARAVLRSGIPEKRTPGYWNNVSQCCGSAGIAESLLDLYRHTHDRRYLAFARRVTADLLKRSTRDAKGTRWVQAEHRVQPALLKAQTGYMQGAAGIGMWLLHLDGFERGRPDRITLPDNPF
jgi:rhamnogalacturonyl hydrolase YesR